MWILWTILGGIVALPVIFIIGMNGYAYWTFYKEEQAARERNNYQDDSLLAHVEGDQPFLVYFTADWCGSCKTMQTPAIERLQAQHPDLQVLTIDADQQSDDAERWGVMSLPRTFIISADKYLVATNIDTASTETLAEQLAIAAQSGGHALQVNRPDFSFNLPSFKKIDS